MAIQINTYHLNNRRNAAMYQKSRRLRRKAWNLVELNQPKDENAWALNLVSLIRAVEHSFDEGNALPKRIENSDT
jgi:hypothetical protein